MNDFPTIADYIGKTPLVRLQRMAQSTGSTVLVKLEGNNPAGSVKDRPAFHMIKSAQERGDIKAGDTLIEATSGNTGIALAMAAAIMGYRMILVMPENMSAERRACMKAYGAEIILVTTEEGMEGARDTALQMQADGKGIVLDQFANKDNPNVHYHTTAPEIWEATQGKMTQFVSSMGTTGTIVGSSQFFKEQSKDVEIIGVQPAEGSVIPGIRTWPEAYLPKIYTDENIDRLMSVTAEVAEERMRELADKEGIFCGVSSGGCVDVALRVAAEEAGRLVVAIVCDRGDRYISTGVFPS